MWQQIATKVRRRELLVLAVVLLGLYVVVPQLGNFHNSYRLLRSSNVNDLLYAVGCVIVTYFAAAGTYCFLAFRSIPYFVTLLVEIASNFVNRLVPAGLGSLGANYAYLRHQRHTRPEALTVVAVNNGMGVVGHFLIAAAVLVGFHGRLQPTRFSFQRGPEVAVAVLLVLFLVFVLLKPLRRRIKSLLRIATLQLSYYRGRPGRLLGALLTSMLLTLSNIASLWFCAHALHSSVDLVTILIIFSVGVGIGTITPSPGGLGGVEAGLVAAFVAYGTPAGQALAIVLLFRMMSYWLPLLLGSVAFGVSQQRRLFSSKY